MTHAGRRACTPVLLALHVVVASAGCAASAHTAHLASGTVVPAVPSPSETADTAGPPGAEARNSARNSPTLETSDPQLAAALGALRGQESAENHRAVGEMYFRRGLLDTAFDHFSAALTLSPNDAMSREGLARIWRDWGFADLALTEAHKAAFLAPSSAATHNTLGTVLLRLGQPGAARAEFDRARAIEPGAAHIVNNICYTLLSLHENASAIDACSAALTIDPSLKTARNNLAMAYLAVGDLTKATVQFSLGGSSSEAAYNIGVAYAINGRYDDAAQAFEMAIGADPSFELAVERLRQVNTIRATRQ